MQRVIVIIVLIITLNIILTACKATQQIEEQDRLAAQITHEYVTTQKVNNEAEYTQEQIKAKDMAIEEANKQKCDLDIVLATIQAETEFKNIPGDKGKALGYGQVWNKHWHDCFEYAAKEMKIKLPTDYKGITKLTLSNNKFSMIVSVNAIKKIWIMSKKNWNDFTLNYVGDKIPENDYNRRLKIWQEYKDLY